MSDIFVSSYNPDVLNCLANLSNDEVFTSPEVANRMLDLLPQEIWKDKNITFLDPATKSGVFLREIAKRLIKGLEDEIPDLQERIDHIFHEQLFGIAITELTSLLARRSVYCSKYPNSKYSISHFNDFEGNIRFRRCEHDWETKRVKDNKGKTHLKKTCKFCGASGEEYERGNELETHAYEWIHTKKPEELFNMKFDVIIGNPPYQLSDGGHGKSAKAIYNLFVEQAKSLNPKYLVMVIPSRWFSGGRGLDKFRADMLSDHHLRTLCDFESFKDIFPGVDLAGGACYFLWDRDYSGPCAITNYSKENPEPPMIRNLDEFESLIRSNKAVDIVRQVRSMHKGIYMNETVLPSKPFGLRTFYKPKKSGMPCLFVQKIGTQFADPKDVDDKWNVIGKWKLAVPRSPIAGQTDFSKPVKIYYEGNTTILPPGTACTESFVILFTSDSKEEVESFKTYLFTKTVRYLLLQSVVSQDIAKEKFRFVPALTKYEGTFSDSRLQKLWGLTDQQMELIDSKIVSLEDSIDGN